MRICLLDFPECLEDFFFTASEPSRLLGGFPENLHWLQTNTQESFKLLLFGNFTECLESFAQYGCLPDKIKIFQTDQYHLSRKVFFALFCCKILIYAFLFCPEILATLKSALRKVKIVSASAVPTPPAIFQSYLSLAETNGMWELQLDKYWHRLDKSGCYYCRQLQRWQRGGAGSQNSPELISDKWQKRRRHTMYFIV